MHMPSDGELTRELYDLSVMLYGCLDKGGELAPTKGEWNHYRNRAYTHAGAILKAFGLPDGAMGWRTLAMNFGYLYPSSSDVQVAAKRRSSAIATGRSYVPFEEDDSYPELVGYWTESVTYEDLGDGRVSKRTVRVFHIR